jgi:hypothetical protein
MKKLIFLLLLTVACQKEVVIQTGVTKNMATDLIYNFKLTESGNVVLPAIGAQNYKESGATCVIEGTTLYAEYHVTAIDSMLQTFRLYGVPIEVGRWYNIRIRANPMTWWLDGKLISAHNCGVESGWVTWEGNDKVEIKK